MGMCVPKEYGGAGADDLSAAIAIEELSKVCASTGDIVATHNGLCCGPILTNGTEEQKQKYLRMLTEGRKVGAFCLTEPNAGSDASKGCTTARLEGDHYVLNGSKIFITNGYVADVLVVFAMSNCIVLDPFLGSGSTMIACEQTGRICYGIELDEKFADVIVNRFVEQTGNSESVFLLRDGSRIPYDKVPRPAADTIKNAEI